MKSNKGFLFTISVILFASTIILLSQTYLNTGFNRESRILNNFVVLSEPLLSDNISTNLSKIIGSEISFVFSENNVLVKVSDFLPKQGLSSKLVDYESFLNQAFFPMVSGTKKIDLNNLKNGSIELFNDFFFYNINYGENKVVFESVLNPSSIDLNLIVYTDLNNFSNNFVEGSVPLKIFYSDLNSSFVLEESISLDEENQLVFGYDDYNIIVFFGSQNKIIEVMLEPESSVNHSIVFFDLGLDYSFDSNEFPLWFDAFLDYSFKNFNTSTRIKKFN